MYGVGSSTGDGVGVHKNNKLYCYTFHGKYDEREIHINTHTSREVRNLKCLVV